MTPRGRTNQLLYQADLLLGMGSETGGDEHAEARRLASEEGALALLELALNALLREVTEHARLERHEWRELLAEGASPVAAVTELREIATTPDSWLAMLTVRLEALHGVDGAARRETRSAMIIGTAQASLGDELRWCLQEFKALLPRLREASLEW
ncbi:hypothetical protein GCM10027040_06340 [Halomonas shantousis]